MAKARSRRFESGTVGYWVELLTGRSFQSRPTKSFLAWPPDAFAVAARMLRESGQYVHVLGKWPPDSFSSQTEYRDTMRTEGENWFATIARHSIVPKDTVQFESTGLVQQLWHHVYGKRREQLGAEVEPSDPQPLWQLLVQICAVADEASEKIVSAGFTPHQDRSQHEDFPWPLRQWILENLIGSESDSVTNLCSSDVDKIHLVTLPKMRTPPNGITMRSLSHNLALLPSTEVETRHSIWTVQGTQSGGINVLFFPWPTEVFPVQFSSFEKAGDNQVGDQFRYFQYRPSRDHLDSLATKCVATIKKARERFGQIDAVVFPEMSLDVPMLSYLSSRSGFQDVPLLIAGLYEPPADNQLGRNYAMVQVKIGNEFSWELVQDKHHRWMLDRSQIETYGLGSRLDPEHGWWESIEIPERTLKLVKLNPSLMLSVLICEDLARPDPVGDAIRAFGPNLLIALLQDGPQLTSRWSARYATVFADDPGCSVLTVTGLGMTKLSRPPQHSSESRVVGLWKQANAPARELELPPDADALMLCLSNGHKEQWTADGRLDGRSRGFVTLSGVHPVFP